MANPLDWLFPSNAQNYIEAQRAQEYDLAPQDPIGMTQEALGFDPSGPLGFLGDNQTIPQTPAPLPPMGMADSLAARSGADISLPGPAAMSTQLAAQPTPSEDMFRKELDVFAQAPPEAAADRRDRELEAAQRARADLTGLLAMARGAEVVGSAIGRTKSDKDYLKDQMALANMPVEDVLQKRRAEAANLEMDVQKFNFANMKDADNPNSVASKFARQTLKDMSEQSGMSLSIPDNISAAELDRRFPTIMNMISGRMAQNARMEAMKLKAGEQRVKQEKDLEEKRSKKAERWRNALHTATRTLQDIFDPRQQMIEDLSEYMNNPRESKGFRDIALTYGFIKGRDDSAVREGEIKLLGAAGKLTDRMRRAANQALKGEMYNKADMQALMDVLKTENKSLARAYQNRAKNVVTQAAKEGIDVEDIVRPDMFHYQAIQEDVSGPVIIREKSTGKMKKVSQEDAEKILADPKYEKVQ